MARHRKPGRSYTWIIAAAGTLAISIGAATAITVGTSSATVTSSPVAGVPLESYNALNDAQQHVDRRATSEKMLKEHLQRAGYGRTATNYATSNVRVDYGAEAKELAGIYMQATAMTEQGMRKQLRSDGFDAEHVEAAVTATYEQEEG
jgi:hypothetical protein